MTGTETGFGPRSAINASWERCERQHKLARDTARPILRLQSSEITPRFEEMVTRTGGRQGIFRQLAEIAAGAGHCLVITDADSIVVRIEGKEAGQPEFERRGIALGSCWDERVAGTNGVAMAMSQGQAFTVRGKEHYFSKLSPFACTGIPILDATNQTIGTINLAAVDRGNPADYLFAKQLLDAASDRVQRILFERQFTDATTVAVSVPGHGSLVRSNELVAINEAGVILGSTARAHHLVGMETPSDLVGKPFDMVFSAEAGTLSRVPGRVLSTRANSGPMLNLAMRPRDQKTFPGRGWRAPAPAPRPKPLRRRLAPSYQELAAGSTAMAALCERAGAHFRQALPFVIEGESGTGKSALVTAIHHTAGLSTAQAVTVDCASLGEDADDRKYIRTIFEQARVIGSLDGVGQTASTLVFDNIDELPAHAQAGLRNLLGEFEAGSSFPEAVSPAAGLRILATSRHPLRDAMQSGRFRDDLYFLLANTLIQLPPLRQRERSDTLMRALARRLAGTEVEITAEAMEALTAHDWPGNVRELRNILQQALMEGDGLRISLVDLRAAPIFARSMPRPSAGNETTEPPPQILYDERSMLLDALKSTRWNVSQAARVLGMGRATIHRKMKQHNISRPA